MEWGPGRQNGSLPSWLNSTMPNAHLPLETLDYIVDLLHDEPEILERCYLISKSWIPRTRKHLFTDIKFQSADNLKSWKETFPDPLTSPAHHTHTLTVKCIRDLAAADAKPSGWITVSLMLYILR